MNIIEMYCEIKAKRDKERKENPCVYKISTLVELVEKELLKDLLNNREENL